MAALNQSLTDALTKAIPDIRCVVPADLYLRVLGDDVLNFRPRGREVTNADIDAVRAALTDAGFAERESWVASEGVSLLSDGIQSVSIRVRRTVRKDPQGSWPGDATFPFGRP